MRDDLDIPYPAMGNVEGSDYSPRDYRGAGKMDANTRRLALIAGGIGLSLLVLMGVWSVTGHRQTGVPVIQADARPVREKPINKGGLQVTGADETILSGDQEGRAVVAPAPEAPEVAALKATPAVVAPPPALVAAAPPEPAPAPSSAPSSVRVGGLQEVPRETLLNANRPTPPPAVAKPVPAPKLAVAAPRPALVASSGHAQVQLAAVGSQQAANGEWLRLSHKYPSLLGGRTQAITRIERDGKTFWRLRVTGFADAAGASAFCGQLKAKGGACAPASF